MLVKKFQDIDLYNQYIVLVSPSIPLSKILITSFVHVMQSKYNTNFYL